MKKMLFVVLIVMMCLQICVAQEGNFYWEFPCENVGNVEINFAHVEKISGFDLDEEGGYFSYLYPQSLEFGISSLWNKGFLRFYGEGFDVVINPAVIDTSKSIFVIRDEKNSKLIITNYSEYSQYTEPLP